MDQNRESSEKMIAGKPPKKVYTKPVVKERKIQNNDPCPCKSGMKFKNCHGKENRLLLQNRVIEVRAKRRKERGEA